jgi:hypothetical protein
MVGRGWFTADDLSTEGLGPLCWVLWNPDVVRSRQVRCGGVAHGWVGPAPARQSLQTAALGASAPSAALFESSYGGVRYGMAERVWAW